MAEPVVRNEEYEATVRASFARQGLLGLLGGRLSAIAPGAVDIELPFRAEITQQQGLFHGGATTTVLDSACGYAALTLMPAGSEVLSVEFKVNFLAPARGSRLVASGRVIRSGRTITVCQGDAHAIGADGAAAHCATMTATMMRVELPTT